MDTMLSRGPSQATEGDKELLVERRSVSVTVDVSIQMSGQYFWINSDTRNRRGPILTPIIRSAKAESVADKDSQRLQLAAANVKFR